MIRVLDLFSGIGGFSLGLDRTGGFETVAFCEIDPFPRAVLAKHWPKVPCYHDVRCLTGERLAADGITVDAICGGFPCQDVSQAKRGQSDGLAGERSGLWSEIDRLVGELNPRLVIIENVNRLATRGADRVMDALEGRGYSCEAFIIGAGNAGAPHLRQRFWLVAHAQGERRGQIAGHVEGSAGIGQGAGHAASLAEIERSCWADESDVCRVAHGLPHRVDRLRTLGNSVVPQIPELIGNAILASLSPTQTPGARHVGGL